jgi:hypothetical protein
MGENDLADAHQDASHECAMRARVHFFDDSEPNQGQRHEETKAKEECGFIFFIVDRPKTGRPGA